MAQTLPSTALSKYSLTSMLATFVLLLDRNLLTTFRQPFELFNVEKDDWLVLFSGLTASGVHTACSEDRGLFPWG